MRVLLILAYGALLSCLTVTTYSQDSVGTIDKVLRFPDKLFNSIDRKSEKLQQKLINQSEKYLQRLQKQERKLQRKISRLDSNAAKDMMNSSVARYQQLQQKLKGVVAVVAGSNNYISHLDSMRTALNFLDQSKLFGESAAIQDTWL